MQLNFAPEAQPTGVQARLAQVLNLVRIGYQYGFIPYVIYLGLFLLNYFLLVT